MTALQRPPLAITMGEPAGIGGEILLAAWQALAATGPAFVALDDPDRLTRLAAGLGWPVPIRAVASPGEAVAVFPRALPVLPLSRSVEATPGRPEPRHAPMALESIERAVSLTRAGETAAVVTNPIQKSTLYAAGFRFPGHTEYLAELAGGCRVVMMLVGPSLRVVPLTIHVALAAVPRILNPALIVGQGRIVARALRSDFGIERPRLAFAGLNPHAGEDGAMGDEEARLIVPALASLRAEGIDVRGPLPADTMFHVHARSRYDVALCMYHDQALIPIKTLDFDEGVNVTLGLPFVRTSPDHGTALDIAGKGVARPQSLIAAIRLAAETAERRHAAAGGADPGSAAGG
ncbi:4-hydroxythreonine-4-phosphate dehydrogenase PdxA [Benzoatithermus flavus]|uniref:4-hydroxythreonine-4-phosphate dehydrogenase n=1 Tax=Benzoatithermus flavus TaxID=3108223 RepID=A0ABU8XRD8_9PROT